MQKRDGVMLRNAALLLLTFLIVCLSRSGLGFSQDNASSFSELRDRLGSSYESNEFSFRFIYISDRLMNHMGEQGIQFPSCNEEIEKLIRNNGEKRLYLLMGTALEITEFDPTDLVFVQGGQQFNVGKDDFRICEGRIYEEIYPETFIRGVLSLPSSFDPTIPTRIWYKKQKLDDFVINAEYRDLISVLRKPVKIGYLGFRGKVKGVHIIELVLEDEFGLSTKWDGVINCQLYSIVVMGLDGMESHEEKELLCEEERKVSKEDFEIDYLTAEKKYLTRETKEKTKVFVYRWGEQIEEKVFGHRQQEKPKDKKRDSSSSVTIGDFIAAGMPVAKLVVSFTLPTGERLRTVKGLSRGIIQNFEEG